MKEGILITREDFLNASENVNKHLELILNKKRDPQLKAVMSLVYQMYLATLLEELFKEDE